MSGLLSSSSILGGSSSIYMGHVVLGGSMISCGLVSLSSTGLPLLSSSNSDVLRKAAITTDEVVEKVLDSRRVDLKWTKDRSFIGHTGFVLVLDEKDVIMFDYGKTGSGTSDGNAVMSMASFDELKKYKIVYDVYSIRDSVKGFTKTVVKMVLDLKKVFINKGYGLFSSNCRHHVMACLDKAKTMLSNIVPNKREFFQKIEEAKQSLREILTTDKLKVVDPVVGMILDEAKNK